MALIANVSMISGILSLLCLLVLYLVSPEFEPSWRMISEYALGKYKYILTLFFSLWSMSTLLISILLINMVTTNLAILGVILIFISGIGAMMGGLFDLKHKLHGFSFLLGVPTFPVGALLISYHLIQNENWSTHKTAILLSAHSVWISLVLMAVSMGVMISGFKKAGVSMGPDAEPPKAVPKGVIAINGYANRILVFCYILWVLIIAKYHV
jgi:hypothetical membrane protein